MPEHEPGHVEGPVVHGPGAAAGDVLDLLRALVSTPSVNPGMEPDGTGEGEIARLTAGWLGEWGFDTRIVEAEPGRPSVLARLRHGPGRSLILNGHLDTVGTQGMTIAPFSAGISDGRVWGRGACDMKAGVAALLAAGRDAAAAGFTGELIIALTADEEEAGIGCRRLVQDGLRADAAIVCEPTGLAIMPAHKGFVWIGIDFHGRAAHGSRPDRGVDAIRHAGQFLARLEELEATLTQRRRHPLLGHASIHAGTIRGGTAPSVYPSSCRLVLERRTLPGDTAAAARSEVEYLLGRLRSDAPTLRADIDVVLHRNGSEVAPDHPVVAAFARVLAGVGIEPRIEGMSAWVEAVVFNEAGTPAFCFGPGRIEDAHSADESVEVEQVEAGHAALTGFVREFLA
ncbi:MAG TPA: ArgE/DapE family deacylase [Longimicrobiales bacterium]|nr:ArgE/DapE family deacylase [Longimicrobiales bacterium]